MRSQPKAASFRAVGSILAAVIAVLALFVAAPAQASTGHAFNGTFGIPFSNDPGGFTYGLGPYGVAVNASDGHVFASDPSHTDSFGQPAPRVEEFDAAGAFVAEFPLDPALYGAPHTLAIDSSGAGAIYVNAEDATTSKKTVLKYSLSGTFQYALVPAVNTNFEGDGLAVDPSNGDVYVGATESTSGTALIEVFDDTGTFQSSFDGASNNDSALKDVRQIAIDGSSRVYVIDQGKGRVDRFSSAGAFQLTLPPTDNQLAGLGVDPATEDVYVAGNNLLDYFTDGGAVHQERMTLGSALWSIAVDPGSGTLYVADIGQGLGLIGTAFAGPTVETTGSSPAGPGTQTLEGTIDPEGIASEYHFEYGQDSGYGRETASVSAGSGNTVEPVADQATELLPSTEYHFRLVGTTAEGSIRGFDQTFTSPPGPPVLDGSAPFVSVIRPDGATLNGTLNPRGSATSWHFEYQEEGAPSWSSTSSESVSASQGDQPVSVAVSGLAANTRYHYRLVADNGTGGPQTGQEGTFWTAPGTPAGGSSITGVSATLEGVVNPREGYVTYHFEYGETIAYGKSTAETSESEGLFGDEDHAVSAPIDRLQPGTTYHVRVVATEPFGTAKIISADGTFTTNPAPGAVTGAVTGVTTEQATFSGEVDTHGLAGSYRFIVQSPTGPFSAKTEVVTVPSGSGPEDVSATLSGLQPGQTYTVRLVVESSSVITNGNAVTFSTAPLPAVALPPPRTDNPYGASQTLPPQASPRAFAVKAKASGAKATLTLDLPGAGDVTVKGKGVKTAKWRVSEAGTYTVKVGLSASGRKRLKGRETLSGRLHITFKPNGGKAATKTAKVTFKEER